MVERITSFYNPGFTHKVRWKFWPITSTIYNLLRSSKRSREVPDREDEREKFDSVHSPDQSRPDRVEPVQSVIERETSLFTGTIWDSQSKSSSITYWCESEVPDSTHESCQQLSVGTTHPLLMTLNDWVDDLTDSVWNSV